MLPALSITGSGESVRVDRVLAPAAAVHACFSMLFSALALRIAYGAGFTASATSDDVFTGRLVQLATGYLLNPPIEHGPASC